jgi:hypothetical protein
MASVCASRKRHSSARRDGSVATTVSSTWSTELVASANALVWSARSATSTSRYAGWRPANGACIPVTEHTSSSPGRRKSSAASRVGSVRRKSAEAATASETEGKASTATVRSGREGTRRSRAAVTTARVPSLPHIRPGKVVAGVVLDQTAQVGDHRAGSEHGLDPEHLSPGVPIAEDAGPAGVGGDHSTHGCRVPARQVHPVGPAAGGGGLAQPSECHAGAGSDLAGSGVDGFHRS